MSAVENEALLDDLPDNDLLATENGADEEEDLLELFEFENGDDDVSLSGSVMDLLECESLGSLKELLKPSKPSEKAVAENASVKVQGKSIHERLGTVKQTNGSSLKQTNRKIKAAKTAVKKCVSMDNGPESGKRCQSEGTGKTPEDPIYVIDTEPDKTVDQVLDLREFLDRKKRKIFLSSSEHVDSKQPQTQTAFAHGPNLFPSVPKGINCNPNRIPKPSLFSLDHL